MTIIREMNKVRFLPWIGREYFNGGIFGKRILVLGESHHCGECIREICENDFDSECRDFTSNVVRDYLDKSHEYARWMNTYTKFERSLFGDWTNDDNREQIWNSILFYNYLQYALDGSRKAGDSDAYQKAADPFYQVLDCCKPELIIVWGKRLWNWLPRDNRWEGQEGIDFDGYLVEYGYYKFSDGNRVRTFPVYHPSTGYDWAFWHDVIKYMLESI